MSAEFLRNLYPFLDQRHILALNWIMMKSQSTYIVRAPFYEIRWAQTSTERTSLAGLFHLVLIALLHYRFHQGHSLIEHLHRHPCLGLCFLGSWPQRVWEKLSVFSMSWRHHKCGCYHAKFSKARVISFFCKELENENFRLCMSHMVSATYYISPFLKTL